MELEKGKKDVGLDMSKGVIGSMSELGVKECLRVKE